MDYIHPSNITHNIYNSLLYKNTNTNIIYYDIIFES